MTNNHIVSRTIFGFQHKIDLDRYPLFKAIDQVMNRAVDIAEIRISDNYPNMTRYIQEGRMADRYAAQGLTTQAQEAIDEQRELEEVLTMPK